MGTPFKKGEHEYHEDELPLKVTVPSFRIGKFPITAREMCAFLNSEKAQENGPRTLYHHEELNEWWHSTITLSADGKYVPRKNAESAPANQVTWKGAVFFCQWYSNQTGKEYRLPSEAEWELVARGAEGRKWPWGDGDPTRKHGERYDKSVLPHWSPPLAAVGSHPANATKEGVFDLLAYTNDEWCANSFVAHPTPEQAADTRADLSDLKSKRIARGYRRRDYPRGPRIIRGTEYGYGSHYGRPWTRVGFDDLTKVGEPASHGFRIVEELAAREAK